MKIKKYLYSLITKSRGSVIGDFLKAASKSIIDALENKDNNLNTNGEFWLISALKDTDVETVFDVGANVGVWTNQFKLMHPGTKVYSFEPVSETFEELSKNTQNLQDVKLFNLALSDSNEQLEFNYYPDNSYFSSIYEDHLSGMIANKKMVNAQTGDDFCAGLGIESIDFLKIDTEGSEPKVLKGFQKMIESGKIKMIQFEYGDINIQSKFLLKDFYELLENNGYLLGKIYPAYIDFSPYEKGKENFIISNFLVVQSSEQGLIKHLSNKI